MNTNKIGVLLANLGTPDEPTTPAVKRYLKQFLSDPRVIDLPKFKWQFILNYMILPKRSPKVAKLYREIWTEQGSPLLAISRQQQQALQDYFNRQNQNVLVELGMSYGNPSIESATDRLIKAGVSKIIVLPLYPQYSSTTTASVLDAFARGLTQQRNIVPFEFIHSYHNDPLYIQALANTIQLAEDEKLLFSFHGIPKRYQTEGDFYPEHCQQTAQLVADKLSLTDEQWLVTYQSRFGDEEWLQPYTDETLETLPSQGVKKIAVICAGFSADCLETLEEIAEENKENFLNAGGQSYRYIPALNANTDHINALAKLIEAKI
ncbi:ferrochelatase [Actinobacillus pleuropneumoniae]|uniref:Ferrochelatase n=1 Tax=Actinobacillus pleuropneumoniae serotype 7 (strain AP76) TaxID=537457 RepID=HEMH_ACTP7|nr:ferrochelatase [Actinobacillus pleuropneumoniae]B3H307.1 RecName: Full=Ferrochelatase; AltName: Full=Heme synthase; AltName: Full=Protoheme ferro-lyase [Actinobacillus pleuropneumoniae serovar 7 str. AP76]ACE62677.1 Ferrochelatase [Actinobacillus pleuropneumoniae serovar 7 str. AP76]EFN01723.1 Ferrochelatase [Actinobacillus pleuropneumoniae serovar 13 str. N273]UKH23605.1 ferrochelatase [Actinobacillus pleuropneumoniae]UKH40076.1 ferrochelatase [Actinobacillus pleuropneumoniae]UQZ25690.1 f